ncbi:hypothetical protein M440DRAFT_1343772 [Trichoderma longibrachiatum ATCC 18648]|uniref:PTR2-domain-containing protein n=1 Tax=Trichoderma longibrachiatum ATCC 18648 TaxID=983965 RepID=A0A2T4BQL1_TRILO|nr:hypothetical protein M440DRAFT_1343772 [Trichoderma longibrachiatum ATCC 18648]
MAHNHEDTAAELHEEFNERVHPSEIHDLAGGYIAADHEKKDFDLSPEGAEAGPTPDGEEPSDYERRTLRRVGENLPASAFLIAVVELMERFTYYGASGLFQNYISNGKNDTSDSPGLGMGGQAATGLNLFFQWFCYVTPILGAIISDQYLGKYKTIMLFCCVYWVGLVILWTTSLPVAIAHGAGLPGYIVSIIVIGAGTGGIKSNIAPLIADQYQRRTMAIRTEPSGERIIIDPAITYQRIYMIFYWCINLGSLSLIATPFMEKYCGFWTAFLMCFCMFNFSIAILVFVFYPIFWVGYGQFSTNFVTQAGQMNGHGMPNDFMQNFDPISILIFTPLLDIFVYPALRKVGINIRPIARISLGFIWISLCLGYAAIVQHLIYNAGPCYDSPNNCDAAMVDGKVIPNNVHIAVQAPAYVFVGLAEIFISVTGLEYAYTKAPPTMKSFVQSLYLFTNAFGSAISEALVSVSKDPEFIWMYTGVAGASFVTAFVFFFLFNHYDKIEDESFELDREAPVVPPTKEVEYEGANN